MTKKRCIAFICFLAVLIGLTACARSSKYGKVITDDKGMEHIIMTDANGVTVVDKFGNLVEVVTDSNNKKPVTAPTENGTVSPEQKGEYQTQSVTFPGLLDDGKTVEDQFVKLSVPKGWESIGRGHMILRHKDTEAQVSIYVDVADSLQSKLEAMEDARAALNADFEYIESDATIGGFKAVCSTYTINDIFRQAYVLQTDREMVIEITCTVKLDSKDSVDFNEILNSIQFK